MRVSILKTDGGDHSPKQWAYATASRLLEVDPNVVDDRFLAASELQLAITRALIKHHTDAADSEHAGLAADADAHLQTDIDVQAHVDAAFADIMNAAKGTEWESQFAAPEMQEQIRVLLERDFSHNKHLKREWHVHRTAAAMSS